MHALRSFAVALASLALAACYARQPDGPPDIKAIYSAALADTGVERPPRDVALDLRALEDSGVYSGTDVLPDSIGSYLLARGLISEICPLSPSESGRLICIPDRARHTLYLSPPFQETEGYRVYSSGRLVKPRSDTSSTPLNPLGGSDVCHVRWSRGKWRLDKCEVRSVG